MSLRQSSHIKRRLPNFTSGIWLRVTVALVMLLLLFWNNAKNIKFRIVTAFDALKMFNSTCAWRMLWRFFYVKLISTDWGHMGTDIAEHGGHPEKPDYRKIFQKIL